MSCDQTVVKGQLYFFRLLLCPLLTHVLYDVFSLHEQWDIEDMTEIKSRMHHGQSDESLSLSMYRTFSTQQHAHYEGHTYSYEAALHDGDRLSELVLPGEGTDLIVGEGFFYVSSEIVQVCFSRRLRRSLHWNVGYF